MSSLLRPSEQELTIPSSSTLLLHRRLRLVEDLWESVLRSECGEELVSLLAQLRSMYSPEGQTTQLQDSSARDLIEQLDLNAAIRASRAFALYFQLIDIVEKHYEQREQQLARNATLKERGTDGEQRQQENAFMQAGTYFSDEGTLSPPGANQLEKSWQGSSAKTPQAGSFQWLFPHLWQQNMPPKKIQQLLDRLEIRLVFTAHPTEIVRHTIRKKQRRISNVLRQLDRAEEASMGLGPSSSWEVEAATQQLTEEIRLWWRTDELHQFKPAVLDEVEYALHYFQEVLFEAVPKLSARLQQGINRSFPWLRPPRHNFCRFGSWVGADRDGNPSVTPPVTWETACYQRGLVLEKYIKSVEGLTELLSLSLHWSNVLPELLDSLEQDRIHFPEVYETCAIRYRQEPYRLKLAYIQKRLENTRDRNRHLRNPEERQQLERREMNPRTYYRSG
ncbi:MAG: phosphoenolpyruvate carboxylase, partial [Cyanobacteriota bacterium]|nr:phosphoenolpyruvate carboxylase [Cyanobacteriota bacterium]